MFYLKQPNTDSYAITITGNTTYSAKAYMYDQSGKVQVTTLTGSGTLSNPDTFLVNFSKTNSKDDKINKSSAFDIIITDINTLYHQEQIKKDIYKQLLQKINEAKNQYTKKHFLQEKISLAELLLKIIVLNGNHKISDSAYQTLVEDIMHLLTQ